MDPVFLQTLATYATLALAIGNAIYVFGRSGVSREDIEREKSEREKALADYKEESLRGFIAYQESQKHDRHEALTREQAHENLTRISFDECARDRRILSERIGKLEK
jgi:hypothetical protein